MTQVLMCAHNPHLIFPHSGLTYPLSFLSVLKKQGWKIVYECRRCQTSWKDGDPEPRVVLGRIESEESQHTDVMCKGGPCNCGNTIYRAPPAP